MGDTGCASGGASAAGGVEGHRILHVVRICKGSIRGKYQEGEKKGKGQGRQGGKGDRETGKAVRMVGRQQGQTEKHGRTSKRRKRKEEKEERKEENESDHNRLVDWSSVECALSMCATVTNL